MSGSTKVVKTLLQYGADVNQHSHVSKIVIIIMESVDSKSRDGPGTPMCNTLQIYW